MGARQPPSGVGDAALALLLLLVPAAPSVLTAAPWVAYRHRSNRAAGEGDGTGGGEGRARAEGGGDCMGKKKKRTGQKGGKREKGKMRI